MPQSKRRKPKAAGPTPPKGIAAKEKVPSPQWYVVLMAGLMVVGVLIIVVRFMFQTPQWLLLVGLAFITAGFVMTTNYK